MGGVGQGRGENAQRIDRDFEDRDQIMRAAQKRVVQDLESQVGLLLFYFGRMQFESPALVGHDSVDLLGPQDGSLCFRMGTDQFSYSKCVRRGLLNRLENHIKPDIAPDPFPPCGSLTKLVPAGFRKDHETGRGEEGNEPEQ